MTVSARFIGGPNDGTELALPEVYLEYCFMRVDAMMPKDDTPESWADAHRYRKVRYTLQYAEETEDAAVAVYTFDRYMEA